MNETVQTQTEQTPDNAPQPEVAGAAAPEAQAPDWRASLPEDIGKSEALKEFKSIEDLARTVVKAKADTVADPTAYKLPEGAPEALRGFAHKNGMTQGQMESVFSMVKETLASQGQSVQTVLAKAGQEHVASWGEQGTENLRLAKGALSHLDSDGTLRGLLKETGYANHPAVLEHFRKVGAMLLEGGFIRTTPTQPQRKKSHAEALYPTMVN